MNVIPLTFVDPRSCALVANFTTQPEDFTAMTSVGYSQAADVVNASDRPQTSKGHCSSGVTPQENLSLGEERLNPSPVVHQHHCFRLDLASPYGHVLV